MKKSIPFQKGVFPGLEKELAEIGAYLAARHYHAAMAGNLSVRVSRRTLLCTRNGADKSRLSVDDFVLCDFSGRKLEGSGRPTSEIHMHCAVYRGRPDVQAVVHAHPPTAVAFAATGTELNELQLPEMMALLGPVAVAPYATPGTPRLGDSLKPFLKAHDAFLLSNHGALTVGRSLWQAAYRMELLEHNAQITLMTRQLGKPPIRLPDSERNHLVSLRTKLANWAAT